MTTTSNDYSHFYRYCLVTKSSNAGIMSIFKECLKENTFTYTEAEKEGKVYLAISQQNKQKMLNTAENLKILKVSTTHTINNDIQLPPQVIQNEKKRYFIAKDIDKYVPDDYYDSLYKHKKSDESWGLGLFTENEMVNIEYQILSEMRLSEGSRMRLINVLKQDSNNDIDTDKKHFIYNITKNPNYPLLQLLIDLEIIEEQFPLHISNIKEALLKDSIFKLRFPYRNLRSYFGDKVGIYYAFVYHYTRLLIVPAILSLLLLLLRSIFPDKTKLLITIYAMLIAVWTQIFNLYWDRKCSEIKIEWDNFTDEYDRDNLRKEFRGQWQLSPITEKEEKYYPSYKRTYTYIISFILSIPLIFLATIVNVFFLNISGSIKPELNSILEIPALGNLTKPGEIFDADGRIQTLIGILNVIFIQKINGYFRKVAEYTCDLENHRVRSNYENSLVIKRFIFEFFDTFGPALYTAFVIHDIKGVNQIVKSYFYAGEIRRMLVETVIPNVMELIKGSNALKRVFMSKRNSEEYRELMRVNNNNISNDILSQVKLEEYDTFDDYLEIVLEFGFLTLFAECFPFAPVIVLICMNFEIRSDLFKLSTVFRRPEICRKRNIGSWTLILQILSVCSVFTNLFFTITFHDHEEIFGYKKSDFKSGNIFKFFVVEHIVFIVIILMRIMVSRVAPWVNTYMIRREYRIKNSLQEILN